MSPADVVAHLVTVNGFRHISVEAPAGHMTESLTLRAPMPSSTPSAWTHLLAGLATAFDSPI